MNAIAVVRVADPVWAWTTHANAAICMFEPILEMIPPPRNTRKSRDSIARKAFGYAAIEAQASGVTKLVVTRQPLLWGVRLSAREG